MKGTFKAKALGWGLGLSNSGTEQVAITFGIVGGPHEGQTLTWYGSFSDQAIERTFESLRHCGWSGDNLAALTGLDANEVEIVVDEEVYEGKARTKVKWVNRPRGPALKHQLSGPALDAFAARMRGAALAHKLKYGDQPAPRAAGQRAANGEDYGEYGSPPPSDDDLNF